MMDLSVEWLPDGSGILRWGTTEFHCASAEDAQDFMLDVNLVSAECQFFRDKIEALLQALDGMRIDYL